MKKIKNKINNEFNSIYLGRVEKINDPERQGRIRVRVFGIHDNNISAIKLPWFLPVYPIQTAQHNSQSDSGIPQIGSIVTVQFINGNISQGIYTGVIPGGSDFENPVDYQTGRRIIKTKTGHTIEIDEGKIIITQDDNSTRIEIKNGQININSEGSGINLSAKGTVNIEAKNINFQDSTNNGDLIINSEKFLEYFNNHIHSTGVGPSSPPVITHGFQINDDWHTETVRITKK